MKYGFRNCQIRRYRNVSDPSDTSNSSSSRSSCFSSTSQDDPTSEDGSISDDDPISEDGLISGDDPISEDDPTSGDDPISGEEPTSVYSTKNDRQRSNKTNSTKLRETKIRSDRLQKKKRNQTVSDDFLSSENDTDATDAQSTDISGSFSKATAASARSELGFSEEGNECTSSTQNQKISKTRSTPIKQNKRRKPSAEVPSTYLRCYEKTVSNKLSRNKRSIKEKEPEKEKNADEKEPLKKIKTIRNAESSTYGSRKKSPMKEKGPDKEERAKEDKKEERAEEERAEKDKKEPKKRRVEVLEHVLERTERLQETKNNKITEVATRAERETEYERQLTEQIQDLMKCCPHRNLTLRRCKRFPSWCFGIFCSFRHPNCAEGEKCNVSRCVFNHPLREKPCERCSYSINKKAFENNELKYRLCAHTSKEKRARATVIFCKECWRDSESFNYWNA